MSDEANHTNGWSVARTDARDHRGIVLPPTWVSRLVAEAPVMGGARVMAVESSRRAIGAIIAAITGARDTVVAGSFLMADRALEDALMAASQRGVRVYVLVAAEARLQQPREGDEFSARVHDEHKQMLDRLAGWAYIRTAEDWHAKAVLVDRGEIGRGFLLTANLTREALSRNEELVVELTEPERAQLWDVLRWVLWEAAQHEVLEPGRLQPATPLGMITRPTIEGPLLTTLRERGALHDAILGLINAAEFELMVCSFGWDPEHAVVQALAARAREGLSVTVLARYREKVMPALVMLAEAGARVVGFEFLHAKAVVADAQRGVIASANLEPHGLDAGIELGVMVDGERAEQLVGILRGWLWRAPYDLRARPLLGEVSGKVLLFVDRTFREETVLTSAEVEIAAVTAASADAIDATAAPNPPKKFGLPAPLAHELILRWTVEPPTLAGKSTPEKGSDEALPRLYREPGGRLVVAVESRDQIAAARKLADARKAAAIVVSQRA